MVSHRDFGNAWIGAVRQWLWDHLPFAMVLSILAAAVVFGVARGVLSWAWRFIIRRLS